MAAQSKLIALNLGLAAGLALIAWQGHARWVEAQAERRANLNIPIKRVTPPSLTPAQKPEAVQAAKYADVAARNPFSKDRNPAVVVEAPKVEQPKVMPPLPIVYGVLVLPSGTKAIMAEHSGSAGRSVSAGETISEFKVVALDSQKVTFEWDGKQVVRELDELVDRSAAAAAASANTNGPAAPAPAAPAAPPNSSALGAEITTPTGAARACKPGEGSPVGTVVDGYRKTGVMSPFGLVGCSWVQDK